MANHFLALDISDEERHRLVAVLGTSGASDAVPGRRVPVANWHITLRFLGDLTDVRIETLIARLDGTLAVDPTRVWVDGIGAFPKPSKASVVFCSVDDPQGVLGALAGLCEEAAIDVGCEPEDRPFHPHLTLSRLRPPIDLRHSLSMIELSRVPIDVEAVSLMRTKSVRGGVEYDRIERIDL
jgi:2'-5' RNA ligase